MSEARYDWLTDRWIILAPDRAGRPNDFENGASGELDANQDCPFCYGNESSTPPPILELNDPNLGEHSWLVRVFANKYPAILPSDALTMLHGSGGQSEGEVHALPFWMKDAEREPYFARRELFFGSHEVIVESPTHLRSLSGLHATHMTLIGKAYQARLLSLRRDPDLKYAVIFKNTGADAGASLAHTHSQLIACNMMPPYQERILTRLADYHAQFGTCYLCDMVSAERSVGDRLVAETQHFVAFCPYASRLPMSVLIVPKPHWSSFEDAERHQLEEFCHLLQAVTSWIERLRPESSYNYVLNTMPWCCRRPATYHWYAEVVPRLSKFAGFEWASDCYINTVAPEHAANLYRSLATCNK